MKIEGGCFPSFCYQLNSFEEQSVSLTGIGKEEIQPLRTFIFITMGNFQLDEYGPEYYVNHSY